MKFITLITTITSVGAGAVAVSTEGYHGYKVGAPLVPKAPLQLSNATSGHNATHANLPPNSNLAATKTYTGKAAWYTPRGV